MSNTDQDYCYIDCELGEKAFEIHLDVQYEGKQELQAHALAQLQEDEKAGFNALLAESAACWLNKVWMRAPITIDGPEFDQLAICFAQYHMQLMTPAHDNCMNIGAKGLSGEGYKGHTFWDTEIFLLPYFIFNMPRWPGAWRSTATCPCPVPTRKRRITVMWAHSSLGRARGWTTAR